MDNVEDAKIIDIEEKKLTNDEIQARYMDIKQVAMLLNNVSTKTAVKYLEEVSESHNIDLGVVTKKENGGRKKLYLKEAVETISHIIEKDNAIIIRVPVRDSEGSFGKIKDSEGFSRRSSSSIPTDSNSFQEGQTGEGGQKLAIAESLRGLNELRNNFKEFSTNLRELNDNVRQVNMTMQNTISKIVEQGIDLKERYLEDRIKRTEIEKQQTETLNLLLQKNTQAEKLQAEALKALAEKTAQAEKLHADTLKILSEKNQSTKTNNNITLIILLCVLGLLLAGWGAFYFFTTNQQKMEYQFEERLSQEKQIQTAQYQVTIKQLKESLIPVTTTAAVSPARQAK